MKNNYESSYIAKIMGTTTLKLFLGIFLIYCIDFNFLRYVYQCIEIFNA